MLTGPVCSLVQSRKPGWKEFIYRTVGLSASSPPEVAVTNQSSKHCWTFPRSINCTWHMARSSRSMGGHPDILLYNKPELTGTVLTTNPQRKVRIDYDAASLAKISMSFRITHIHTNMHTLGAFWKFQLTNSGLTIRVPCLRICSYELKLGALNHGECQLYYNNI